LFMHCCTVVSSGQTRCRRLDLLTGMLHGLAPYLDACDDGAACRQSRHLEDTGRILSAAVLTSVKQLASETSDEI
jgi:hypothetical protein